MPMTVLMQSSKPPDTQHQPVSCLHRVNTPGGLIQATESDPLAGERGRPWGRCELVPIRARSQILQEPPMALGSMQGVPGLQHTSTASISSTHVGTHPARRMRSPMLLGNLPSRGTKPRRDRQGGVPSLALPAGPAPRCPRPIVRSAGTATSGPSDHAGPSATFVPNGVTVPGHAMK